MTAETASVSLDALDAALAAAIPDLDGDGQQLAAAVLRLLSAGQPVSVSAAATVAEMPESHSESLLHSWPGVFWDGDGRVTGFWGMALATMPHRIQHAGVNLQPSVPCPDDRARPSWGGARQPPRLPDRPAWCCLRRRARTRSAEGSAHARCGFLNGLTTLM